MAEPIKVRDKETGKIITIKQKDFTEDPVDESRDFPGSERVRQIQRGRRTPSETFKPAELPQNRLAGDFEIGGALAKELGVGMLEIMQRAESVLGGAMQEVSRGQAPTLERVKQGASGEIVTEVGDVVRQTSEFGGIANEALSSLFGLTTTITAGNFLSAGRLAKGAKTIKSFWDDSINALADRTTRFGFKRQADKLAQGVDDVFDGLRKEADNLYNKAGLAKKPISEADDLARVNEITGTLKTSEVNKLNKIAELDDVSKARRLVSENIPRKTRGVIDPNLGNVRRIKTVIGESVPKKVWSGIDDATEEQALRIQQYFDLNDIIAKNAGALKDDLLTLNGKYKELHGFNRVIKGITRKKGTGVTSTQIRNIRQPSSQGELFELMDFQIKYYPATNNILKDVDRLNRMNTLIKNKNKVIIGAGGLLYFNKKRGRGITDTITESSN